MSNIIPFSFEGVAVRAVLIDGEPHLAGKDVAGALAYADPDQAVRQHCKALKKLNSVKLTELGVANPPPSGLVMIPEPDVLRLIIRSKLPAAERFERWVFEEVLPTIRKTGAYGHTDPLRVLNDPAAMRGILLNYCEKVLSLQAEVTTLTPKADALDRLATTDGSLCITDAAKSLQVPPRTLFQKLRSDRWIYQRQGVTGDIGYQDRINAGLLEHKTTTVSRTDGTEKTVTQVRVTPKGLAALALALGAGGNAASPGLPLA